MKHLDDLPDCPSCGTTLTIADTDTNAQYRCPNDDCSEHDFRRMSLDSRGT